MHIIKNTRPIVNIAVECFSQQKLVSFRRDMTETHYALTPPLSVQTQALSQTPALSQTHTWNLTDPAWNVPKQGSPRILNSNQVNFHINSQHTEYL